MTEQAAEAALAVDPEHIGRRLRLELPMDGPTRYRIVEAIQDAMADVQAYLGQPVLPTTYVETGLYPHVGGWTLTQTPVIEVISAVPEVYPEGGGPTGTFAVTYLAGLDTVNDPALRPIRKEIIARVMEHSDVVSLWQAIQGDGARRIKSSSVEGQSVGYDFLTPTGGTESAAAKAQESPQERLKRLDRWRKRSVYQRRGPSHPSGLRRYSEGFYL